MLPTRVTKVARTDEGGYIEYLSDRAEGREDLVAYMREQDRAPSRWLGGGAAALGLEGPVDPDVLRAYAECRDPDTGEKLGKQLPTWGGYESAFAATKDTSALWAIWAEMRGAIEDSVWIGSAAGIGASESIGSALGRGSIRRVSVCYRSAGHITGGFLHGTARPAPGASVGNPHLHCHAYTVNRILCADGQWRAIYSDVYVRSSRTAVYGVALVAQRHALTEKAGVGWELDDAGVWRIAGMPVELDTLWSQRHHQVLAAAVAAVRRHLGWPPTPEPDKPQDPAVDPVAAAHEHLDELARAAAERGDPPPMSPRRLDALIASFSAKLVDNRRQRKPGAEPEADRFDRWADEAARAGIDIEAVIADVVAKGAAYRETLTAWAWPAQQPPVAFSGDAEEGTPTAALEDLASMLETRTTWLYRDVLGEAAKLVAPGADVEWAYWLTNRVLSQALKVPHAAETTIPDRVPSEPHPDYYRGDPTLRMWQARSVAMAEAAIEDAYLGGVASGAATAASQAGWDDGLSEAQASEIERVCTDGDRISCIVGPAGAGKTTLMAAVARRFTSAGHKVTGLAVAGAAVHELHAAGVEDSRTVASVLRIDPDTAHGRSALQQMGRVWIWDEASMANTLDAGEVLRRAEIAGAKVILVGDPDQMPSVGAGGMFGHLVDELGAAEALEEVHRFHNEWEGHNSLQLRAGHPEALDVLDNHDRIAAAANTATAAAIAQDFTARTTKAGAVPLITAYTRRDVHDLNQAARQALPLGEVVHQRHRRDLNEAQTFAVGDIIVTGRVARRIRDSEGNQVNNGNRWRILGTGRDRFRAKTLHVERITDDDTPPARASLPATYIDGSDPDGRPWIEHGIATTIHRAQGRTVDHSLTFGNRHSTRNSLYVGLTRGRHTNQLIMLDTADTAEALQAAKTALKRRGHQTAGLTLVAEARREAAAHIAARKPGLLGASVDIDPDTTQHWQDADQDPLNVITDDDAALPDPTEPSEAVLEPSEPPARPEDTAESVSEPVETSARAEDTAKPAPEALEALRAAQARHDNAHRAREQSVEDLQPVRVAVRVAADLALAAAKQLERRLDSFSVGDAQQLQKALDTYGARVQDADTAFADVQGLETELASHDEALAAARNALHAARQEAFVVGDFPTDTTYRPFKFPAKIDAVIKRLDERLLQLSLPPGRPPPAPGVTGADPPPILGGP